MGKRHIKVDPDQARAKLYELIDRESRSAIWEALKTLSDSGIDIGPKAEAILVKRSKIKTQAPKS